ncbi:ABC transporter permease [Pirellulales bacterium]|nr:ABC transporter permease [Pirellulales bacterium]
MSFLRIAWRNLEQRALASSLTGLSMALGVALMVLVLVIYELVVAQLSNDAQGYHLIIGAGQGSKTEIVLTSVFHVGQPLYPFGYRHYKKFVDGDFAPYVDVAVPICLGDSYESPDGSRFRVVGTTPDMFDKLSYAADKKYEFRDGRNFKQENFFEAVIGSVVANRSGLTVGDKFQPTHGISTGDEKHKAFEIVGILAPTGTANDRAAFINMEGFYLLAKHALSPQTAAYCPECGERLPTGHPLAPPPPPASDAPAHVIEFDDEGRPLPLPEAQREVTSILVRCKEMLYPSRIEMRVNKSDDRAIQVVMPRTIVEKLKDGFLAPMRLILFVLTVMIVVVAGISILVSIYNSMNERSRDIAVMRALGASRAAVMAIIIVESILLSLLGGVAGLLLGHGILALASPIVENYTGVTVAAWNATWQELLLVPGLLAFAAVVGFLPAVTAYRTDVAGTLAGIK